MILLVSIVFAASPSFAEMSYCDKVKTGPCQPPSEIYYPLKTRLDDLQKAIKRLEALKVSELEALSDAVSDRKSLAKLAVWNEIRSKVDSEEATLKERLPQIAADVAKAFRVPVDFDADRELQAGDYKGLPVKFAPKVIFTDKYFETKAVADGSKSLTFARDYGKYPAAASTLPNGTVVFRLDAFTENIDALAAFVHHESVHFRQWTTKGGLKSKEEMEVDAYDEVLRQSGRAYGLNPTLEARFKIKAKENWKAVKTDIRAKLKWHLYPFGRETKTPPELLTNPVPTGEDWYNKGRAGAAMKKDLDEVEGLRKSLQNRLAEEKAGRDYERRLAAERGEAWPPPGSSGSGSGCNGGTGPCLPTAPRSEQRYPAPPNPVVAVPPVMPAVPAVPATPSQAAFSANLALNQLAAKGCEDPWGFPQSDLDWYWARLSGTSFDGGAADRLGLQGCQYALYMRLMQMASERNPERLTREIFAQAAASARAPADSGMSDALNDPVRGGAPAVPTCRHHPWCQRWGQ